MMGFLMYRVLVRRTGPNHSFAIGNYSSLYIPSCSTTRVCKFANHRDIDVFEVVSLEIKATLLGFK